MFWHHGCAVGSHGGVLSLSGCRQHGIACYTLQYTSSAHCIVNLASLKRAAARLPPLATLTASESQAEGRDAGFDVDGDRDSPGNSMNDNFVAGSTEPTPFQQLFLLCLLPVYDSYS